MFIKEWQVKNADICNYPEGYNALVLGDEGCVHKAIHSKWIELFRRTSHMGLQIRYLTPITPQNYIKDLYEYIREMSEISRYKVTFNDYGLLYLCKPLIKEKKIIPVLGRVLTRSIFDCAWQDRLLENENKELNKTISKYSFQQDEKMNMLKEFGIEEMEFNLNMTGDMSYFRQWNIKLTCYLSNAIAAVGRLCYAARWYELNIPACKDDLRCRSKLDIELQEMWGKGRLMYEVPTEEMRGYFKDNYVEGNIVFIKLECNLDDIRLNCFDSLILTES